MELSNIIGPVLEVAILFAIFYALFYFLQGTRGASILHGLLVMVVLAMIVFPFVVHRFHLRRIEYLMDAGYGLVIVALIVLFQAEFRRALVRLGEAPLLRRFLRTGSPVINEVCRAAEQLSELGYGGLIAIEREVGLGNYIEGGRRLDAETSGDLLVSIFWPGNPLHDGAVVIRDNRITAAGVLFPLTENPDISRTLGTRHRAAIGLSEESDAVVIVVSEETHRISVAYRGRLTLGLNRASLHRLLDEIMVETTGGVVSRGETPT